METAFLSVDGINVHFGGIQALCDVSFSVARGECVALIGPNGAGKTTLLNVIAGALAPASGRVFFREENLIGLPAHRVNARGIVRTFQGGEVIRSLTVRENVASGGVAAARVAWASALANLGSVRDAGRRLNIRADDLLNLVGLSDESAQLAALLPAGRQRLLGLSRALATEASLVILDEPGAGLNETEKRHLVHVIRSLCRMGKTIIFIEHDMEVVGSLAARIIVLDRGRVIADDVAAAVRNDPQVIGAYLGSATALAFTRKPRPHALKTARLLSVTDLCVQYGGLAALDRVSLDVRAGEIVALVGSNGAGKSTLLKTIAGVVSPQAGSVQFVNAELTGARPDAVVQAGISLVPEGRELFASLSVLDNLLVGRFPRLRSRGWLRVITWAGSSDPETSRRLDLIYGLFPVLHERRDQLAGTLSGGEAQMLAIGRALMAEPRLLMLDEPSVGIAPQVFATIMRSLNELRDQGTTVLLVEQNARAALQIADRAYVLAAGHVVADASAHALLADADLLNAYLGGDRSVTAKSPVRLVG